MRPRLAPLLICAVLIAAAGCRRSAPIRLTAKIVVMGPIRDFNVVGRKHPMYGFGTYVLGGPVVCRIEAPPRTRLRIFAGVMNPDADAPGRRVLDVLVQGRRVMTFDPFNRARGEPSGFIVAGETDAAGVLTVAVQAAAAARNHDPIVCGFLVYPGDQRLRVDQIVAGGGPEPIATLLPRDEARRRLRERGMYFTPRPRPAMPPPDFARARSRLPAPIYDERPDFVACYWKAWEMAFRHWRKPAPGSPFVADFIDEGFNESLFLFDTSFVTMFSSYGRPCAPGIEALDNFYVTQMEDGEIVRQMSEAKGLPVLLAEPGSAASLNHPIAGWAEREAYRFTGDRERLKRVFEPLRRYYEAFAKVRDAGSGLYIASFASMDNSPRVPRLWCGVDTSAEVAMLARDLAWMAGKLGRKSESARYTREAERIGDLINRTMWDERSGFYYDLGAGSKRLGVKTVAGFWPLLAGVADQRRAALLARHLTDPKEFRRRHLVPSLAADDPAFSPTGSHWCGGVWSPMNTMVIRGLERTGRPDLARAIALNHLDQVTAVCRRTGTLWEYYAPDLVAHGSYPRRKQLPPKRDFVGWTGLAPIMYLIEYAIGIRPDAAANTVTWSVSSPQRVGISRLWFGGTTAGMVCEAARPSGRRRLRVEADHPFRLVVTWRGRTTRLRVPAGREVSRLL
jgi:hypothetical protein